MKNILYKIVAVSYYLSRIHILHLCQTSQSTQEMAANIVKQLTLQLADDENMYFYLYGYKNHKPCKN